MNKKEAIEIIKNNWPDSRYTMLREALQTLIPELRESEDEKIRKEIIELVQFYYGSSLACKHTVSKDEMIAWLEKQGGITKLSEEEQNKFAKGVLTSSALSFIDYLDAHRYEGKMCVSNWECEDIENAFHNAMWDRLHRYYCKYIEKQGEQNPAWSEEDDKLYTSALWHIKNSCGNGGKDSGEFEVYNWLKSLKDRVQPQPKQEWSEEDEPNEPYNPYKVAVESILKMAEKYEPYCKVDIDSNLPDFLNNVKVKCKDAMEYDKMFSQEEFVSKKQYEEDLDKAYKNADIVQFNRGMSEVLNNPKKYFHVGDTIRLKNSNAEYTITSIFNGRYYGEGWSLDIIKAADDYELVKKIELNPKQEWTEKDYD